MAVPASVWPGVPAPASCGAGPDRAPCPRRYTADASARVVTALTRPGELVVIPGPATAALITASAACARRVLGLPDGLRQYRDLAAAITADLDPAARPLARLLPGGAAVLLDASSRHAGRAALVIITACPAPGCDRPAGSGPDASVLFAACQRVLRPGGLLAVITSAARAPGQPGEVTALARAAGLLYAQHIIALHAPVRDGCLLPPPAAADALPEGRADTTAHSDLLLYQSLGGSRHD